jgi:hypothetical protein
MDARESNVEKLRDPNEAAKQLKRDLERQNAELAKLLQRAKALNTRNKTSTKGAAGSDRL